MKGTMDEGKTMRSGDQNKGTYIRTTLEHTKEKDIRSEQVCKTLVKAIQI